MAGDQQQQLLERMLLDCLRQGRAAVLFSIYDYLDQPDSLQSLCDRAGASVRIRHFSVAELPSHSIDPAAAEVWLVAPCSGTTEGSNQLEIIEFLCWYSKSLFGIAAEQAPVLFMEGFDHDELLDDPDVMVSLSIIEHRRHPLVMKNRWMSLNSHQILCEREYIQVISRTEHDALQNELRRHGLRGDIGKLTDDQILILQQWDTVDSALTHLPPLRF
ncbi:hypothetical protein HBA55_12735 [Pseudomaricurvus alkylphenolicus]|uniref:hypothetical protein n=1 Tax=Pseudomaricurvus alkylphenolicus TaxID=1306991 RepID=UPI00141E82DE|nr:hypothetical protein [Pseudomaricurvus alkylphenolicus]NIB40459.1 hypothetical protein [Pseudomaricurvus alkylphenolicus]